MSNCSWEVEKCNLKVGHKKDIEAKCGLNLVKEPQINRTLFGVSTFFSETFFVIYDCSNKYPFGIHFFPAVEGIHFLFLFR